MKQDILEPFLADGYPIILDGALATELERRGADLNDPLWSAKLLIEYPQLIEQVHYDYFMAGADIAISSTYQASFDGFARRGIPWAEAADLMRLSVQLACDARERFWSEPRHRMERSRPLVAGSVGPFGAYLADGSEYRGDYGKTVGELIDFHRPRMALLVDSPIDLLACETIPCATEAEALLTLLADYPRAVAWMSFSCHDGQHISFGDRFADCVEMVEQSPQVIAIGVNCTQPRFVESLLLEAATKTEKPLLAYPNRGETWDARNRRWRAGTGLSSLGQMATLWCGVGAGLIGGCCRTTPDDIEEIVKAIHQGR